MLSSWRQTESGGFDAKSGVQPKITIINLDADTAPTMYRVDVPGVVGTTDAFLRLARMLKEEDALIVNLTITQGNISLVGALKDGWNLRVQKALFGPEGQEK